jgi:hypothetical protein
MAAKAKFLVFRDIFNPGFPCFQGIGYFLLVVSNAGNNA